LGALTLLVLQQEQHVAHKKLNGEVQVWLSVWSKVQITVFAYGPADATATHHLLLH